MTGVLVLIDLWREMAPFAKVANQNSDCLRPIGLAAGELKVPDDFDAPLPDEILAEFEGR